MSERMTDREALTILAEAIADLSREVALLHCQIMRPEIWTETLQRFLSEKPERRAAYEHALEAKKVGGK